MSQTEHMVFRPIEPTTHEFRCAAHPDIAIVVHNEPSVRAACIKLRVMLDEFAHNEDLNLEVVGTPK